MSAAAPTSFTATGSKVPWDTHRMYELTPGELVRDDNANGSLAARLAAVQLL